MNKTVNYGFIMSLLLYLGAYAADAANSAPHERIVRSDEEILAEAHLLLNPEPLRAQTFNRHRVYAERPARGATQHALGDVPVLPLLEEAYDAGNAELLMQLAFMQQQADRAARTAARRAAGITVAQRLRFLHE